jgi:ComF family protein
MPSSISVDLVFNRFIENFQPDDIAINNAYGLFFVREDADYLKIIHGLKYNGFRRIGKEFGKELGNKLVKEVSLLYDGIVPVPIHHARLRERGFNQSEIIAESISEVLNVPVVKPIKRRIYTPTQTQLSKSERKVNLIDAIVPADNSMKLTGNFLLIDDVLTTGSTINECATIMLQMGAIRVDCAVLAVA